MRWRGFRQLPRPIWKLYEDFAVFRGPECGCPTNFNSLTVSWYLNHSNEPNVGCDKQFDFFALRDIEPGEELTADYSSYSDPPPGAGSFLSDKRPRARKGTP
jgi:hypothetical protein